MHGQDRATLLILIHVLVPLSQFQQLLEHLHPLRLQLTRIHELLIVLPPGAHVALLWHKLGGFAMIGFQEVDGLLPFGQLEFELGHKLRILCGFRRICSNSLSKTGG